MQFLTVSMLLALLSGCGSMDISTHYATQQEITARFSPGRPIVGHAVWDRNLTGKQCDVYIITPEEFSDSYPQGYIGIDGGGKFYRFNTWDDLYAHELRHCDEGNFHL